jgi:hypothetical protein
VSFNINFRSKLFIFILIICISNNAYAYSIFQYDTEKIYRNNLIYNENKCIGVTEIRNNAGIEVEAYLSSVGLRKGNAWCCAFQYYNLSITAKELGVTCPMNRTGLCYNVYTYAKHNLKTTDKIKAPALIIWNKSGTTSGHIGLITKINQNQITTIEGNTGSGNVRDGDGVYKRNRKLNSKLSNMQIICIINL